MSDCLLGEMNDFKNVDLGHCRTFKTCFNFLLTFVRVSAYEMWI